MNTDKLKQKQLLISISIDYLINRKMKIRGKWTRSDIFYSIIFLYQQSTCRLK
jgi:hypothetical protein